MKDEIETILRPAALAGRRCGVEFNGKFWVIKLDRRSGARIDGASLAREMMAREEQPVKDMEIPEEIEIPRFLAPDPLEGIPDALRALAEPGETVPEMQARLWTLWRELNGKLMLNLAGSEEIALHTRLHNELHWIAPPIEGE